jgi:predicted nicotinamide N-methyase
MAQDRFPDETYEDWRFSDVPLAQFDDVGPRAILVKQDWNKGRGGFVWDASYVLAKYLADYRGNLQGKRVLELGAGCALPSLAAAVLGAEVVSTDIMPALDLTQENVALNHLEASVTTAKLDWSSEEDRAQVQGSFDLILLSDLFYLPSLAGDFVTTLRRYCGADTEVLMTYKYRVSTTVEPYLQLLAQFFTIRYLRDELQVLHPHPKLNLAVLTLSQLSA